MKDDLRLHIARHAEFSDDEMFDILSRFAYASLKKGERFYREGGVCRKIAFIRSGAVRSFYNLDGEEVTRFAMTEHSFFTAFESFFAQQSSPENIEAIEATELYTLSRDSLHELYLRHPNMLKLGYNLTIESHMRLEKRVFNLIALSAEQRYIKFRTEQAEMLERIPLQYVASILGMKPETLSRIRKKVGR